MKTLKPILILIFGVLLIMTSCRTEDDLVIDPPIEDTIEANSTIADLVSRTASNDGSFDNIIDYANCVSVQLPVTVTVNGIELEVNDQDGYEDIEDIIDLFDDDVDSVVISYPITVVLPDFSEVIVNSDEELAALSVNCAGENEDDEDIECIDFEYPITASVYNETNDLIDSIIIENDNDMYDFIEDLDEFAAATINFPINVIFPDGTVETINTIQELADAIANADGSCDEDDDNDFDDDDCNECTTTDLDMVFANCATWTVDKLEIDDDDLEDNYIGYAFEFNADGSILVTQGANIFNGTWEASGAANNISLVINITDLSDFNATWNLHEIEQNTDDEVKVDLRLGDDRLRFESTCTSSDIDDTALVSALTTGDWYVTYYFDDTDETADYADYTFNFATDNTATATNMSGATDGSWLTLSGDNTELALLLNFGSGIPLDDLADDWDVLEVTNDIIRLKDISGGDGSEDFLTFERTPFDDGIDDAALVNALTTGDWYVTYYFDDTDETVDYVDYTFNFAFDNSATAMDMSGTTNGSWSTSAGDETDLELNLDFGMTIPLDDLAEDWDVLEVTNDIIRLKDISGGDGSEDFLTFERTPFDGGIDDTALVNALTTGDWYVTYYFDDTDETVDYVDYTFNFAFDNSATAMDMSGTTNGSWSTSAGDETDLELNLDFGMTIPLDDLAEDWDVLEVTNDIIRLKDISGGDGSEDFLTFERTPFDDGSGGDDLESILIDGLWIVSSYTEDADDQTADYAGYELNFNLDGTVSASNGPNTNNGTWSVLGADTQMTLNFGTDLPFQELNDNDWNVISVSSTEVIVQDVSGGGGGTDTLTLQKL